MESCQQWDLKNHLYNNDFSQTVYLYSNDFRNSVMKILKKLGVKDKSSGRKTSTFKICFFVIKIQSLQ